MKTFQYKFNLDSNVYKTIIDTITFNEHKKEKEILDMLVKGKTCEQIAMEVGYSTTTIKRRRKDIYEKIKSFTNNTIEPIQKNISFVVYILIFPNNKVYVGQTCDTKTRWFGNGIGYKQNKEMYKDIQEYGWENITKRIMFKNLTLQQSLDKEKEMIIHYKSNIPKYGYNKKF